MFSAEAFKSALGLFPSGVTVLTWQEAPAVLQGITVSAFSALSLSPPLVLFCIGHKAYTYSQISQKKYLCINILSSEQGELAYQFSRGEHLQKNIATHWNAHYQVPMLEGAQAQLIAHIQEKIPRGDHDIFIAQIEETLLYPEKQALLYYKSQILRPDYGTH